MLMGCGTVCVGVFRAATVLLPGLSPHFQSLPLLPINKLGPSGADSQVGGWVYVLGPCGSPQWTLLWVWEFLLPTRLPQIFIAGGFEALVSCTGALGCVVGLAPQLFLLAYLHANVGSLGLPALPCLDSLHLQCPSPPLLPFWMNVSSLTPWLSDFHAVWFSGTFGCFMFLNLLSFLLCEEAKCMYLCLHLGWKWKSSV